jgi:hypothetical protein
MPSPFPGMDPWIEGSPFWEGFHHSFVTYLRDDLRPLLPPGYRARMEVRVYVEREELRGRPPERVPDVEVYRTGGGGGAAVLEHPPIEEGILLGGAAVERREAWIGIRSLPDDALITAIEVLSPSNKKGSDGRGAYLLKQEQLSQAGVNLVEIDLLRGGTHTLCFREELLARVPPHHYLAAVYRAAWPQHVQVIHWTLREALPTVPVPLAPETPEPRVALQPIFERAYDNGDLGHFLRARGRLSPPLAPGDEEWARSLCGAQDA